MNELLKKLQFKNSEVIAVLNSPEQFQPQLAEISASTRVVTELDPQTKYDFVLVFVKTRADIQEIAAKAAGSLKEDGLLWFAYPKKSSKRYKSDISRDEGWQPLGDLGFEGVRQVAIDEDWSCTRFRDVRFIKSMTRGEKLAMSAHGKERIKSAPKG